MKIKFFLIFIIILCSIHSDIFAQKKKKSSQSSSLIGTWETVPNALEASYLTLQFNKDKKFSFVLKSTWKGKYKLNGTQLITYTNIPILNKVKTDSSTVLIYSDTLIQISKVKGEEVTVKMYRQRGTSQLGAGIIGTWIMSDPDGEFSTFKYSTDGTFEVKNILRSFKGNYVVKEDTVSVFSNGVPMFKNRYVFERGLLLLYSKTQSAPVKLQRVKK